MFKNFLIHFLITIIRNNEKCMVIYLNVRYIGVFYNKNKNELDN